MQTLLELTNKDRPGFDSRNGTTTPNHYFQAKFPLQTEQFGPAFLEMKEAGLGLTKITPVSINQDFFASILSDPLIGLSVVYYEPEMQFYFKSPFQTVYKPVTPEKLQNLSRGLLIKCAEECEGDVNLLNLFHEFRSDKIARAVVNRAKSILAADPSYFSPTSPHSRERGIEVMERVARKFVEEWLSSEPGQILKINDAFAVFRGLLRQKELPDIKRSDFKAVVVPLVRDQFNVALRNDLGGGGGRGWKGVKMLQTGPG